jgi:hypothetical protein
MFINRFLDIGFKQSSPETWSGSGWSMEFKYYPDYLVDNHYTLVTFTYGEESGIKENTKYRLYIHTNLDRKYVGFEFDISYDTDWNKNHLDNKLNELFKFELRDSKLKELLNER